MPYILFIFISSRFQNILSFKRRKFFLKDFIYLFMRDTEREAETQTGGEAGSLQEPDAGLHPRALGSRPELKGDAQLLSQPGIPRNSRHFISIPLASPRAALRTVSEAARLF